MLQNYTYTEETKRESLAQLRSVLERSAVDQDFRKRLLINPNQTYSEATGTSMPENFSLKFVENRTRGIATFVLPAFRDGQLNDSELESVSGGSEPVTVTAGAVCLGILAVTTGVAVGLWLVEKFTE
jgi:hypothetical protein